jgi:hypothetical protein
MSRTYEIAMAAARDAANRNMRKASRLVWNEDDYNVMVSEFNRLMPEPEEATA